MISEKEIEHLKNLARVEFDKKETEQLAKDLGDVLGYVDQLKEADVSGVAEMTHALEGVKNIMRADVPKENAADLTHAFPEKNETKHGTYLKVKSVL